MLQSAEYLTLNFTWIQKIIDSDIYMYLFLCTFRLLSPSLLKQPFLKGEKLTQHRGNTVFSLGNWCLFFSKWLIDHLLEDWPDSLGWHLRPWLDLCLSWGLQWLGPKSLNFYSVRSGVRGWVSEMCILGPQQDYIFCLESSQLDQVLYVSSLRWEIRGWRKNDDVGSSLWDMKGGKIFLPP